MFCQRMCDSRVPVMGVGGGVGSVCGVCIEGLDGVQPGVKQQE